MNRFFVIVLLCCNSLFASAISQKQRAFANQQSQLRTHLDTQSQADAEAEAEALATVEAESLATVEIQSQAEATTQTNIASTLNLGAEYKSDALDELLGDSLFKKKKQTAPASEDTLVDTVLNAKVDLKELNLLDTTSNIQSDDTNIQIESSTTAQKQQSKDINLIQQHLQQFTGTKQPEVGSAILYSAINDLDLGEAKIPEYAPPGMPAKGVENVLYGSDLAPASAWSGSSTDPQSVDLTQLTSDDLNGQSPTRLSEEAYIRNGNKYEEQAESLIDNQEKEFNDNTVVKQLVQLQKEKKEQEDKETEEMISTAFSSMKKTSGQTQDVGQQIKMQNDLMYVAAFGS